MRARALASSIARVAESRDGADFSKSCFDERARRRARPEAASAQCTLRAARVTAAPTGGAGVRGAASSERNSPIS